MFAIVRTGGKQYRVAAGDKIVVEKLPGEAGDTIQLGDVLLAGEGADLRSTDGLIVAAEIIAQAKSDKVTVFKKRRRHNYRRKQGHRQQLTILRILSIGGEGAKAKAKAAKPAEPKTEAPAPAAEAEAAPAPEKKAAKPKKDESETPAAKKATAKAPLKAEGAESEMTDTPAPAKRKAAKPKKDSE